ncbi:DeoR/GlpR family DNA-binding transcription regulator [Actinomadura sp. ATCC 31491]|uniref:Lactose phosphotransferase system repressor n=1 Tax=Actinomadura luzonensis TaxID=2805427 RepID=A0ABT0FSM8_9ACTN|nr:DeoR/GlpR family DNA-binding transcription regulator [Actinomadura luzonensis]MCK2215348.1 DeoR/GlpR family DNA-binding transcription regulator [Actinomadura luzonensis]
MSSSFQGRAFDRQQRILDHVRSEGRAVVSEIAGLFAISPATLRRDLRTLEAQRLIVRSYGAFYPTDIGRYETPVEYRHKARSEERLAIAEAAVDLMADVGTVLLDEGALPEDLVGPMRRLERMTVVTRSLTVAAELGRHTEHDVIIVGGRVRPATMGTVDRWATAMLGELNVDLAFMGANGVSIERGLTTPDPAVAQAKSAAMRAARQVVLLCEHTRFGVTSFAKFADVEQLAWIITGKQLSRSSAQRYGAVGPRVLRV